MLLHEQEWHHDFNHPLTEGNVLDIAVVLKDFVDVRVKMLILFQDLRPYNIFVNLVSVKSSLVPDSLYSEFLSVFLDFWTIQDLPHIGNGSVIERQLELSIRISIITIELLDCFAQL